MLWCSSRNTDLANSVTSVTRQGTWKQPHCPQCKVSRVKLSRVSNYSHHFHCCVFLVAQPSAFSSPLRARDAVRRLSIFKSSLHFCICQSGKNGTQLGAAFLFLEDHSSLSWMTFCRCGWCISPKSYFWKVTKLQLKLMLGKWGRQVEQWTSWVLQGGIDMAIGFCYGPCIGIITCNCKTGGIHFSVVMLCPFQWWYAVVAGDG